MTLQGRVVVNSNGPSNRPFFDRSTGISASVAVFHDSSLLLYLMASLANLKAPAAEAIIRNQRKDRAENMCICGTTNLISPAHKTPHTPASSHHRSAAPSAPS